MDWLLDHFEVWFLIAVAIIAILRRLKALPSEETESERSKGDAEAAERTRRIQEEIRRRILERRGLAPPPLAEMFEQEPEEPPEPEPSRPMPIASPPPMAAYAPELERQQHLLRRLEEMKAMQPVRAPEAAFPSATADAATSIDERWAELRQAGGLRRAVIWREILGPPVGLRQRGAGPDIRF